MSLAESILLRLCRSPQAGDYANEPWDVADPLSLFKSKIPDFLAQLRGQNVVDFGCGSGQQSLALLRAGTASVVGIEIDEARLAQARALAAQEGLTDRLAFGARPEEFADRRFDFVLSQNAMEHFDDPKGVLAAMKAMLAPGGRILLTFGPPWLAPYGSHMHFFCHVPWIHLMFSERTVMRVRRRFRTDTLASYREAGLNRMTVARFERTVAACGMRIDHKSYDCVKGIDVLGKLPLLRELFVNHITCVLTP
jgi:SAM-dependent methyltransferase